MATIGRRTPVSLEAPAVLLIEPQLPENIGATARAMMNCGLTNLRLVRPREQWPNERAREVSSGAHEPIDKAQVYPSARAAMADLTRVYATSARHRQMIFRGPQILPDGQHVGSDRGEITVDLQEFIHLFAEADHYA